MSAQSDRESRINRRAFLRGWQLREEGGGRYRLVDRNDRYLPVWRNLSLDEAERLVASSVRKR